MFWNVMLPYCNPNDIFVHNTGLMLMNIPLILEVSDVV